MRQPPPHTVTAAVTTTYAAPVAAARSLFGQDPIGPQQRQQLQEHRNTARTNARLNFGGLIAMNSSASVPTEWARRPTPVEAAAVQRQADRQRRRDLRDIERNLESTSESESIISSRRGPAPQARPDHEDAAQLISSVQAFRRQMLGSRWASQNNRTTAPVRNSEQWLERQANGWTDGASEIDLNADDDLNTAREQAENERALRQRTVARELARRRNPPRVVPPPAPVTPPVIWDGDEYSCSICLQDLSDNERAVRLRCRHVYHAECWDTAQQTRVALCPNCRAPADLIAVWRFIGQRTDVTQGQPNLLGVAEENEHAMDAPNGLTTDHEGDAAGEEEAEETVTAEAFPTFYKDIRQDTSDFAMDSTGNGARQGDIAGSSDNSNSTSSGTRTFLSATSLSDGRHALLVDVGSFGNLAGRTWVRQAAALGRLHGKVPTTEKRAKPLSVSGVGEGEQTCTHDCTIPVSMKTIDGRTVTGTYTSPTVNQPESDSGGIPGLLGLRSLMERRAILNFSKGPDQMTISFCGPGDVTVDLSPGTDTFRLYQSPSGHLMIPCCEHESAPTKSNREEEVALVSVPPGLTPEPARATVSTSQASSSNASVYSLGMGLPLPTPDTDYPHQLPIHQNRLAVQDHTGSYNNTGARKGDGALGAINEE